MAPGRRKTMYATPYVIAHQELALRVDIKEINCSDDH